jgi:hypothetical protein
VGHMSGTAWRLSCSGEQEEGGWPETHGEYAGSWLFTGGAGAGEGGEGGEEGGGRGR